MIDTLLLFGSTGDLASRLLFPALASLHAAGQLPSGFRLVGTGRQQWDDDRFREHIASKLAHHASHLPRESHEVLIGATSYCAADTSDPHEVANLVALATNEGSDPVAAYLALPQGLFASTISAIHKAGLPPGSRIVVEKPFGEDLEGAQELNGLLESVLQSSNNTSAYRVDHVLGMAPLQNLIGLRFANPWVDAIWNSEFIEQIDVLWEETLALEGRATFYDKAGALKDVLQNHMIQVLCYAGMDRPASLAANDVQDKKVALLNAVRLFTADDVITHTQRGRYTAGIQANEDGSPGNIVPDYVDEKGVDAARNTETFAEVVLHIDNARWQGTKFVIRTGKSLRQRRKEIVLHFRQHAQAPHFFGDLATTQPAWRIGIDGPMDMTLGVNGTPAETLNELVPFALNSPSLGSELPPYAWVLADILSGDSARSIRGDEAEAAWRIVMPVLESWAAGAVPMLHYPAGSDGPPRLEIPE